MAARNPFEALLAATGPATDTPRAAPRDLMADAFLSQLVERLTEADRAGFVPGVVPLSRYAPYEREMNGLPVHQGFGGIHNTFSPHPFATQHLGNHGGAVPPTHAGLGLSDLGVNIVDPYAAAELGYDPSGYDPSGYGLTSSDPNAYDPAAIFAQDVTPYAGPDAMTEALSAGGTPPPVVLADPRRNPFGSDPTFANDSSVALNDLARAVRPGMASLNALGYQPTPGAADPYGQDLRNYLRRLLRAV